MAYKAMIFKPTNHEDWLAFRNQGIGASEIGAIMGVSKFATPYSLWRLKKGLDEPKQETVAMMMGHLLEEVVATRFQMETENVKIVKASAKDNVYYDPKKPFMRATPDRILKTPDGKALLECKTTSLKIDADNIPMSWLFQVQYQMRVTGIHKAYLAWLIDGRSFGCVEIPYNEEIVEAIEDAVTEFWVKNVQGNIEPSIINGEDAQAKYPASVEGKTMEADDKALTTVQEICSLKNQIKALEANVETLVDELKMYMGENESIVNSVGSTLITWKSGKPRKTFDSNALKVNHPDIYEKFLKESKPSRTFLVKVGKE